MADTEPTPWHQTSWAKGALWFTSIITLSVLLARYFNEPRTELIASYRQVPFVVPAALQDNSKADSITKAADKLINQLLYALRARSTAKERAALDSLNPPSISVPSLYSSPLRRFIIGREKLCELRIKNEGDKTISKIQILVNSAVYYEYNDSNGSTKSGEATGKLDLGELSPTESRVIYIWNNGLLDLYDLNVIYSDGKVRAQKPVEVTGATAWLVEHWFVIFPCLLFLISIAVPFLTVRAASRRQAIIAAAKEEALLEVKQNAEIVSPQADEVSQQFNSMLGVNKAPPTP